MGMKTLRTVKLFALASGVGLYSLCALEAASDQASLIKDYEERINSADPAAADRFLKDTVFLDKLAVYNPVKAADLKAKAVAVAEYSSLLDRNWPDSRERNLSEAMALRLTAQSPLAKVGLAPEPEKTLAWAAKYKKYSASKKALLEKAARNWDAVFKGLSFWPRFNLSGVMDSWEVSGSTGPYFMFIDDREVVFKNTEAEMKAFWATMTLQERNNYLNYKADSRLNSYIENSTRSDFSKVSLVGSTEILRYLDGPGQGRLQKYIAQMNSVEIAKTNLEPSQLDKLSQQPIDQQLYLLGNAFDKSEIQGSAEVERGVDKLRPSKPGETISAQNNWLLVSMLGPAMLAEVKGTVAGEKLAGFYASGAKLDLAIESCQGCYAKYEPSSGKLIFDSELIQQYMRANNITTEILVGSREQISLLGKYLAPMLAHEGTHQMQHAWADKAGVYKPYVQEDEVEANSMEALYTMEKLKTDPGFKSMMTQMRYSSIGYADKRLELAAAFSVNTNEFNNRVRQVYYPGLPSFDAASSQILSAVSDELSRRNYLAAADLAEIEGTGIGLEEALGMTTQELSGSLGEIKTAALKKIQDDLLHSNLYQDHYRSAGDWTGSMQKAVKKGGKRSKSVVPAL